MKKLTLTDRKAIVAELQAKQATMTALAARYNVSISAIGYVFKKMTGNGLKPQLSQSDRKAIVAALQSGKTTEKELSTTYSVASCTIGRVYKQETGNPWKPKLSNTTRKTIVADLLAGAKKQEVVTKYGVHEDTIERIFKRQVGNPLTAYKKRLNTALKQSRYRAWQTGEKKMYPVLGLDWFNQKVLIVTNGVPGWYPMDLFILMEFSGLRDRKRTPEYPNGQRLYVGDIVQFTLLLKNENGEIHRTIIQDVVAFDKKMGMFIVGGTDEDPLCLYADEGEALGNIYENPELMSKTKSVAENSEAPERQQDG